MWENTPNENSNNEHTNTHKKQYRWKNAITLPPNWVRKKQWKRKRKTKEEEQRLLERYVIKRGGPSPSLMAQLALDQQGAANGDSVVAAFVYFKM